MLPLSRENKQAGRGLFVGDALTLHVANAVVAATFAVACFTMLRYFPARRELAVIGTALAFAIMENILAASSNGAPSLIVAFLLSAFVILPYQFAVVAFAVHKGLPLRFPRTALPSLALGLAGFAIYSAGGGYLWRFFTLQVAIALPLLEIAWLASVTAQRTRQDLALAAVAAAGAFVYLARIPAVLMLFDLDFTRDALLESRLFSVSMVAIIINMTAAMLLFLASIAGAIMSEYRKRAERDPLTGIFNRRAFEEQFVNNSLQGGVVVIADLDHFKGVNDAYGHETGDKAICTFARMLDEVGLICARLGGEEFGFLLPCADTIRGKLVSDGLRMALSMNAIDTGCGSLSLTASFGVARYEAGEGLKSCLSRADAALYRAKQSGRNRVCVDEPEPGAERRTIRGRELAMA